MIPKHRHERTSWIIFGGLGEWCFVCGAFRPMSRIGATNNLASAGPWRKPSGDPSVNPYVRTAQEKWESRRAAREMNADIYGENGNG